MQSLWILLSTALTAAAYAFVKLLPHGFAWYEIFFVRMLFMFVVVAALAAVSGMPLRPKAKGLHFLRSAAGIAALSLNILVVRHLPLGTAQTLAYTGPLFVTAWAAGAALVSGRRPDGRLSFAVLVGFAGIAVMMRPSLTDGSLFYMSLGLLSGAVSAVSGLTLKALGRAGEPVLRTVFLFSLTGLMAGGLMTTCFPSHSPEALLAEPAFWGVGLCTIGAQLAQTNGWGRGRTMLSANLQFSAVLFAALFGVLFFDETLDAVTWIGMAVILTAECGAVTAAALQRK